jgi:sulfur dioxygenase
MIFRQLFEPESSTYTYLLGCRASGDALLIDPVLETIERDLALVRALGLRLAWTLETHVHADHVTGASRARDLAGSRIAAPAVEGIDCADLAIREGRDFECGSLCLRPLHTPGHTDSHHCYVLEHDGLACVFTGDCLLIDGCGRTDFQNGSSRQMFRSIRDKLFLLADETLVYPAHDYQGRFVSSIAQEKARNPRVGLQRSEEEFLAIMASLDLPRPKRIEEAVPANMRCGAPLR